MRNLNNKLVWILGGMSAVLMSLPYLIPHCGFISLFAIVPLLCAEKIASDKSYKAFTWVHYCTFLIFNALTTYWVCNATIGGGIFAIVANAFQMSVVFGLFRFSKRFFKGTLPYIFLAAAWIAWERMYYSAEISWPWLVLGNSFAGSCNSIQWYEYTGTLGGSLWIWLSNLSIFALMLSLADGRFWTWNKKAQTAILTFVPLVLILPFIISAVILNQRKNTEEKEILDVLVLQPNIDPYHKFEFLTQKQQNEILKEQIISELKDSITFSRESFRNGLLIIAPETFTNDVRIIDNQISSNTLSDFSSLLKNYPGTELLFGASSYEFIPSQSKPSYTARNFDKGMWIESHNSALLTNNGKTALSEKPAQIYQKSRLVVAVEKTPYPRLFCKIDDMLGGVMGRCIGQEEAGVLRMKKAGIAPVICYESIYGEYCCEYVRKGAQMLAVITNDAWWKDTAGYKQHLRYACLRAIETRRWVARSANTGISAIIDSKGHILEKTHWWKKETIRSQVRLSDEITFFVKYGDICGRVCTFLFLLLTLRLLVCIIKKFCDK